MNLFDFFKQSRLVKKREIKGLYFVLPFIIGFFGFVFFPMLQSLIYSFNDLKFEGKVFLDFVGIDNYINYLNILKPIYLIYFYVFLTIFLFYLLIIYFYISTIKMVAVFLNGKFPGQATFQMIFFIPVIVSAGIIPELFENDIVRRTIINASSMTGDDTSIFNASLIGNLFLQMNLPSKFIEYIMYAITNILDVLNSSGIQILIFLIALKAIPKSLYEASSIEGATVWEGFWKITFPMVLPQLLVNVVYTIIDSFSNNVNPVMKAITDYNFGKFQFGYAASLAWTYFVIVIIVLCVFMLLIKKMIKHYN